MSYASPGRPSARWQHFVDARPIASLALVGVIATQLGTYFGYVFPAFGLPVLPWPLYNGILGTTFADGANGLTNLDATFVASFATSGEAFFVGNSLHFVNGIVFAILFGILFREDVPIKNTFGGNIAKGLVYAVIMSIISAGLLVPYAYVPNQGYGFFLFDGPDGWKLPFAILVWHLIYGLFLGLLYQPTRVDVVERAPVA
jgi:riboflavin transporter FmnP